MKRMGAFTVCITAILAFSCEQQADEGPMGARGAGASTPLSTTALSVSIGGEPQEYDSVTARLIDVNGLRRLQIVALRDPDGDAVDDDSTLEVNVELLAESLEQLVEGKTELLIDGTASFPAPGGTPQSYGDDLAEAQVQYVASPADSMVAARVWIRNWCFCTRYGAQHQNLQGSIVLDAWGPDGLRGTLHLELTGDIPFFGTGFGGGVVASLDVEFDTAQASEAGSF